VIDSHFAVTYISSPVHIPSFALSRHFLAFGAVLGVVHHGGLSDFLLGDLQSGRLLSPFICSSDNMDYGVSLQ
jgi:hypothetical protein